MTLRPSLLLAPLCALAPAARVQEGVTQERVQSAFVEVRAAVESALAFAPAALELRFVEPAAVAERITAENLPMVRLRQSDPAKAEAEARSLGFALSQFAFAKYAWSTHELLVVTDRWEEQAEQLGRPEMCDDATLRAVLVHELMHARDDAEHDIASLLLRASTSDAAVAANALLEGHAQFEARRVCARAGWSAGFDTYTTAIGALPESAGELDEVSRTMLRVQSATIAAAYNQGERFVAALFEAGGAELVARAFREPPADGDTIFHPEWYLDPTKRPRVLYDAEPALDLVAARYPEETWSSQRASLQQAQVEAALALLPTETVANVVRTLRAARVIVQKPQVAPDSKMVVVALMEFEDEAAARAYLDAARRLGELKAERMKTGSLRITDRRHTELDRPAYSGYLERLHMKIGPTDVEVVALDAARGPLVAECVFSGEPIEDEALAAFAGELLDAARPIAAPAPR